MKIIGIPFIYDLDRDCYCWRIVFLDFGMNDYHEIHVISQYSDDGGNNWYDFQEINSGNITVDFCNMEKKVELMILARDTRTSIDMTQSPYVKKFMDLDFKQQKQIVESFAPKGPFHIEICAKDSENFVNNDRNDSSNFGQYITNLEIYSD